MTRPDSTLSEILTGNGSNMSTRPGSSDGIPGPSSVSESDHRSFGFQEDNIYKKKRDRTNNCHIERRFISDCHKYHKDTSYPATK